MNNFKSVISTGDMQKHTPEELKKIRFERLWEKADCLKLTNIDLQSLRVWIIPELEEGAPKPSLIKGIINGYEVKSNLEFNDENEVSEYVSLTAEDMNGTEYREKNDVFIYDEKEAQDQLDELYEDINCD